MGRPILYKNALDCARKIVAAQGIGGLYRGRLGQSPEGEAPMVEEHTCVLCQYEAAVMAATPICVACPALQCLLIFCADSERAMAD